MKRPRLLSRKSVPGVGLVPHVCVLREVGAAVRPLAARAAGRLQAGRGLQEVHPRQDDQRREGSVSNIPLLSLSLSRGKLARPKLFVYVVVRGKCYLIFQLTITITVDISVDNNNCRYTGQLLK